LLEHRWRANEIGTASNSAEKKNRPREGVAEGGFGGNSASPERNQIVASPAVLLVKSRTLQNSFLFLLEEKNRRAQIKKCEENFFVGWRGFRATAGLASLLGVLLKKCSNINQKTPPFCYSRCPIFSFLAFR
jgi:hypothetical protein